MAVMRDGVIGASHLTNLESALRHGRCLPLSMETEQDAEFACDRVDLSFVCFVCHSSSLLSRSYVFRGAYTLKMFCTTAHPPIGARVREKRKGWAHRAQGAHG
jgi:hypothetical protein